MEEIKDLPKVIRKSGDPEKNEVPNQCSCVVFTNLTDNSDKIHHPEPADIQLPLLGKQCLFPNSK